MDGQKLTKKELKALRKQERRQHEEASVEKSVKWKWFIIGAIVCAVGSLLALIIYKENQPAKPLPGTAVKELGREHITDISGISYTSNPPTSGNHFAAWAKRGVYPTIISDGYLLHALEHGYIVISYNCGPLAAPEKSLQYTKGDPLTTTPVDAKSLMSPFTPETLPKETVSLSKAFYSEKCTQLVKNLAGFLGEFQRVVIVPRTNLDVPVVLTAWGRIEKFKKLDTDKMRTFIAAFHNAGPEQTTE